MKRSLFAVARTLPRHENAFALTRSTLLCMRTATCVYVLSRVFISQEELLLSATGSTEKWKQEKGRELRTERGKDGGRREGEKARSFAWSSCQSLITPFSASMWVSEGTSRELGNSPEIRKEEEHRA